MFKTHVVSLQRSSDFIDLPDSAVLELFTVSWQSVKLLGPGAGLFTVKL